MKDTWSLLFSAHTHAYTQTGRLVSQAHLPSHLTWRPQLSIQKKDSHAIDYLQLGAGRAHGSTQATVEKRVLCLQLGAPGGVSRIRECTSKGQFFETQMTGQDFGGTY